MKQINFDNGKITDLNLGNAIIVSGGEPYYKTSYSEYNTENNVVGTKLSRNLILSVKKIS